jgi:hypothetical protein
MFISKSNKLTKEERVFLVPKNSTHRQYEALRAFFVDNLPSQEAARRFGYSTGSFRILCHQFRKDLDRPFFLPPATGPQAAPKQDRVRELVISLRKKNFSVYDIEKAIGQEGHELSAPSISILLREAGFARLPRRRDEERPVTMKPDAAVIADARKFRLESGTIRTQFGGIFLFLPYLSQIPMGEILGKSGFPGSQMIPSEHAMRSLLALKLHGERRRSHVMSYVFDEGLALFAGLNEIPKRSFLTEYSCRINPTSYPKVMNLWFDAVGKLGLERGISFDVDFHTIPFHGNDALVEKHYVSKRSRRQKGMLAFLVWDADKKHFCYADASLRKEDQNDAIISFLKFWKERTGRNPEELVFDSKLTTYANLSELNKRGINFITLRRRSKTLKEEIASAPPSAWRRIELENIAREFRTPRIIDQRTNLDDYQGVIRQINIQDLGHEEPTILLTNQLTRSARNLVGRYAKRMIIENAIADGIDFFHIDALSSSVAMKVDCDLQLTLMASSLYRLLGAQVGEGYETAQSRHIFRDFINATAQIAVTDEDVLVRFQKRAHNPLLIAAGFGKTATRIPWWGNRRLKFQFG